MRSGARSGAETLPAPFCHSPQVTGQKRGTSPRSCAARASPPAIAQSAVTDNQTNPAASRSSTPARVQGQVLMLLTFRTNPRKSREALLDCVDKDERHERHAGTGIHPAVVGAALD